MKLNVHADTRLRRNQKKLTSATMELWQKAAKKYRASGFKVRKEYGEHSQNIVAWRFIFQSVSLFFYKDHHQLSITFWWIKYFYLRSTNAQTSETVVYCILLCKNAVKLCLALAEIRPLHILLEKKAILLKRIASKKGYSARDYAPKVLLCSNYASVKIDIIEFKILKHDK